MGLDRTAGALLMARSDAPGAAARAEIEADGSGLPAARRGRGVHDRRPGRGRGVRGRPPGRVPGAGAARARCCSRTSACALPALPTLVDAASSRSPREHDVDIAVVAHAGDGNTHPLVVYDAATTRTRPRARTPRSAQVMDLALELGGTITGEHGVGRLKKAWLPA